MIYKAIRDILDALSTVKSLYEFFEKIVSPNDDDELAQLLLQQRLVTLAEIGSLKEHIQRSVIALQNLNVDFDEPLGKLSYGKRWTRSAQEAMNVVNDTLSFSRQRLARIESSTRSFLMCNGQYELLSECDSAAFDPIEESLSLKKRSARDVFEKMLETANQYEYWLTPKVIKGS